MLMMLVTLAGWAVLVRPFTADADDARRLGGTVQLLCC